MKKKTVARPARLLWIVPVLMLQWSFENAMTGMMFGILMGFITAKIFPWVEYESTEEADEKT